LQRGISDHSGTIWPALVAASRGYAMAEVHVVFSRECFGPDVTSSITTAELKQLCEGVKFIRRMGRNASKDALAAELSETRKVFCES
jgi:N-acetylneuraminate synthase